MVLPPTLVDFFFPGEKLKIFMFCIMIVGVLVVISMLLDRSIENP